VGSGWRTLDDVRWWSAILISTVIAALAVSAIAHADLGHGARARR
jgi:hypothetical protein